MADINYNLQARLKTNCGGRNNDKVPWLEQIIPIFRRIKLLNFDREFYNLGQWIPISNNISFPSWFVPWWAFVVFREYYTWTTSVILWSVLTHKWRLKYTALWHERCNWPIFSSNTKVILFQILNIYLALISTKYNSIESFISIQSRMPAQGLQRGLFYQKRL